ncbi:hypothetical protein EDB84DRAFT_988567 [Lactarius hengduanensis]|nr:hypothetical protein EDB84DRAFT_988567 [Lactarius hengduanensis]
MSTICEGIPSNPDISGIGIRINFYVTIFITAVIPRRRSTEKLIDALNANAGITGFGLLIAAIIQTFQNRLDLYHAIFVLHIVYFLGLIVYFSGVFKWTLTHIQLGAVSQITTLGAFLAWSIYVWANAVTFGSAPECNGKIEYILWYHSVSATAPWVRKFWVIGLGVTTGFVVLGIIGAVLLIRWAGREGISEDELNLEALYPNASRMLSVFLLTVAISSTVMLQLLVKRNRHLILPGETDWAFGQVLSLVMIVVSLREVLNFLIDRVRRWGGVGDLGDDSRSSIDLDPELHMMRRVSYTQVTDI